MTVRAFSCGGTVTRQTGDGYTETRQVPTFYLLPQVQGSLTEEAARKVAAKVIDPFEQWEVHVWAVQDTLIDNGTWKEKG